MMDNYIKGANVEEEITAENIPIPNLPKDFLWMKVKGGTKLFNVVSFATQAIKSGEHRTVVWTGSGGAVPKTISCAEVMKRDFEMHQVTIVNAKLVEEYWDPMVDGLDRLVVKRQIPAIYILLTLDEIDKTQPGYQFSKDKSALWTESLPAAARIKAEAGANSSNGGNGTGAAANVSKPKSNSSGNSKQPKQKRVTDQNRKPYENNGRSNNKKPAKSEKGYRIEN